MTAAELSLDAAFQADITKRAIALAMAALTKEGGKLTQEAISRVLAGAGWVVVAELLGLMAIVCPAWVGDGVAGLIG